MNFTKPIFNRMLKIKFPEMYQKLCDLSKFNFGVIACWLLALVPASPMWLSYAVLETRPAETDGSMETCSFPYTSVSYLSHKQTLTLN